MRRCHAFHWINAYPGLECADRSNFYLPPPRLVRCYFRFSLCCLIFLPCFCTSHLVTFGNGTYPVFAGLAARVC
jgi:hypothetical protein